MKIEPADINRLQKLIASERDESAYKTLFFHFYKPLFRFAYSFTKSKESAEEIVSDVMMKIWSMKAELAEINNLKVYLFRAIKNTSINYLSKTSNSTSWDIEHINAELYLDLYTPEDFTICEELRKRIQTAIKELPPKCQMVYKLVREDGFSYKEVASILEISENTVDRHLNNALHKLINAVKVHL
jgi:RNA polymerase sigma-70 factor (ECF subfamily)